MSASGEKRAPPGSPPVTGQSAVAGGSARAAGALHSRPRATLPKQRSRAATSSQPMAALTATSVPRSALVLLDPVVAERRVALLQRLSESLAAHLREELVHALLVGAERAQLGARADAGVQAHDLHLAVHDP